MQEIEKNTENCFKLVSKKFGFFGQILSELSVISDELKKKI